MAKTHTLGQGGPHYYIEVGAHMKKHLLQADRVAGVYPEALPSGRHWSGSALAEGLEAEPLPEQGAQGQKLRRREVGWYWRPLLLWLSFIYLELLLRAYIYDTAFEPAALLRIALFAGCYAALLALLTGLLPRWANYALVLAIMILITLLFLAQYFYYLYFRTPLLSYSIFHAGQVAEFSDQTFTTVLQHWPQALAMVLPLLVFALLGVRDWPRLPLRRSLVMLLAALLGYFFGVLSLGQSGQTPSSPYNCYYNENNPPPTQEQLGMLTFMRLDTQRLLLGFIPKDVPEAVVVPEEAAEQAPAEELAAEPEAIVYPPNMLDIDFAGLMAAETDPDLQQMHEYFTAQPPTLQNEYTGLYAGCNLILIIAEGFSHYLFDTGMFPTLERLATEGFEFTDFYTPLWNVSTSDGEYTVLTGLLPKSGVWSMTRSADNYLPFTLGNQLNKPGYPALAYHNHNYQYYDRQLSHPNLGYEFKAQGKGLNVTKIWPESDLQMMELSIPEYIENPEFHVYYLTVSGHLEYNFYGNNMAARHRDKVADLPYSEEVQAYIACNLELEYAMDYLLQQLETAGQLDNTVIALCSDHYPYGLSDGALDELAGHQVERTFEVYQNEFILWKQGAEHQVIDTPACSLDVLPTLSNLFGLDYDSRLLMGRDIFSDGQPLVIFNDRSWITDQGRYNAATGQAEGEMDQEYIDAVNQLVNGKFTYSAMILDRDYYRVVLEEPEEKQ